MCIRDRARSAFLRALYVAAHAPEPATMTCVNVTSVNVLDNPSRFVNPFQFEISFECIAHITDDIEWKLTYVGSAESDQHDQELDSVLVGPMQVGGYKIVFQADPPDPTRIPPQDLLGVTVVLLSCFYKDREFIRVCLLYTSPSPRDATLSRMPSSA